jgi:hypothetical protein
LDCRIPRFVGRCCLREPPDSFRRDASPRLWRFEKGTGHHLGSDLLIVQKGRLLFFGGPAGGGEGRHSSWAVYGALGGQAHCRQTRDSRWFAAGAAARSILRGASGPRRANGATRAGDPSGLLPEQTLDDLIESAPFLRGLRRCRCRGGPASCRRRRLPEGGRAGSGIRRGAAGQALRQRRDPPRS